ncbi:MAG: phospholipase [Firmicutes bacterium]|nr:phospholipase [Bacillota bacterium]
MLKLEKYYGKTFRSLLWVINPFKKKIIKTECKVHRFINYQSLKIINKYNYDEEFNILNKYLEDINEGVVWADQDFKSIGHFYNPIKKKGLYGHNHALGLALKYYKKALYNWNKDKKKAMFYLGASVHIIQDLTIPQHVNIRLLDSHRQYENFVKLTYKRVKEFRSLERPIIFSDLKKYIEFNSKISLKIYKHFRDIESNNKRFYKITLCALPLAQRTTAGCLLMFFSDIKS